MTQSAIPSINCSVVLKSLHQVDHCLPPGIRWRRWTEAAQSQGRLRRMTQPSQNCWKGKKNVTLLRANIRTLYKWLTVIAKTLWRSDKKRRSACGNIEKSSNSLFGNEHLDGKNSHEDEGNAAQRVVQTLHFREAELEHTHMLTHKLKNTHTKKKKPSLFTSAASLSQTNTWSYLSLKAQVIEQQSQTVELLQPPPAVGNKPTESSQKGTKKPSFSSQSDIGENRLNSKTQLCTNWMDTLRCPVYFLNRLLNLPCNVYCVQWPPDAVVNNQPVIKKKNTSQL